MQHLSDATEMEPEPESEGGAHAPPSENTKSLRRGDKVGARRATIPNGVSRKRVAVERDDAIDPVASASAGEVEALPAVLREAEAGRRLVVPSSAALELALDQANTLEDLVAFESMITVLKKAGETLRVVRDEAIRIATCDMNTQRKIGSILLQVDRRGGDRAKDHDDPLLKRLLDELGKNKVRRYREIARIEESHFRDYLQLVTEQREVPTDAGALRHARKWKAAAKSPTTRKPKKSKIDPTAAAVSLAILEAVQRALGRIDVCIGDAKVTCEVRLDARTAQGNQIRGRVFVSQCGEPRESLKRLAELRRMGVVEEVIVVLPADVGAAWFKLLAEDEWHCCFPTGGGLAVAYAGLKKRGFAVTFGRLGAVLCGCATAESS